MTALDPSPFPYEDWQDQREPSTDAISSLVSESDGSGSLSVPWSVYRAAGWTIDDWVLMRSTQTLSSEHLSSDERHVLRTVFMRSAELLSLEPFLFPVPLFRESQPEEPVSRFVVFYATASRRYPQFDRETWLRVRDEGYQPVASVIGPLSRVLPSLFFHRDLETIFWIHPLDEPRMLQVGDVLQNVDTGEVLLVGF